VSQPHDRKKKGLVIGGKPLSFGCVGPGKSNQKRERKTTVRSGVITPTASIAHRWTLNIAGVFGWGGGGGASAQPTHGCPAKGGLYKMHFLVPNSLIKGILYPRWGFGGGKRPAYLLSRAHPLNLIASTKKPNRWGGGKVVPGCLKKGVVGTLKRVKNCPGRGGFGGMSVVVRQTWRSALQKGKPDQIGRLSNTGKKCNKFHRQEEN